jgi:putative Mg2+ transporter-C (MgtC) family protein
MDWNLELLLGIRAVIAAVLGGMIGIEREWHGQDAGIRTYAAVALGACAFGLISSHLKGIPDNNQIASAPSRSRSTHLLRRNQQ